jgi:hypothetical protein
MQRVSKGRIAGVEEKVLLPPGLLVGCQLWAGCSPVDSLWANGDCEGAFSAFLEEWTVRFLLMLGGIGVDELYTAGTQDLETIVKVCAGGQRLGTEAGARVVDLEEEQRLCGVIAYGSFDVRGVAPVEEEDGKQ